MKKYVLILAAFCALAAGCSKKSVVTERFSSSVNELKSDEFGVIDFIPNGELPSGDSSAVFRAGRILKRTRRTV